MSTAGVFCRSARGSVGSVGERALIGRIRRWLGKACPPAPRGIGDDCAVLAPVAGKLLVTVDPVIHGVHFDATTSAAQAGAKLMKRNVSDIAAMGGRPLSAVVALAMDPRVSLRWLEAFYRGLAREARRHGVCVAGGDVAQAPGMFAATLTLIGEARGRALTRTGARAGDLIFATGVLGRSFPSGHHHRFTPRLREGAWLAARPAVRSMMDLSDGLAKDLPALVPAGCEAAVFAEFLPLRPGASVRAALCDGEDYELVFTVSAAGARGLERQWRSAFPRTRLSRIGRIVRRGALPEGALELGTFRGYEHLAHA
jgi:thiamine-monophosphate kinase